MSATGCIALLKASLNLITYNQAGTASTGTVGDGGGLDTANANLHLESVGTYDRFNIEYEV